MMGRSLFDRLLQIETVPVTILDTQYRMHPDIAKFPCEQFYGGEIEVS